MWVVRNQVHQQKEKWSRLIRTLLNILQILSIIFWCCFYNKETKNTRPYLSNSSKISTKPSLMIIPYTQSHTWKKILLENWQSSTIKVKDSESSQKEIIMKWTLTIKYVSLNYWKNFISIMFIQLCPFMLSNSSFLLKLNFLLYLNTHQWILYKITWKFIEKCMTSWSFLMWEDWPWNHKKMKAKFICIKNPMYQNQQQPLKIIWTILTSWLTLSTFKLYPWSLS